MRLYKLLLLGRLQCIQCSVVSIMFGPVPNNQLLHWAIPFPGGASGYTISE
jgi:hypothetical protein